MARLIKYVGRGQIRDAATKCLVSPHEVVREYNLMARMLEAARGGTARWYRAAQDA